MCDANAVRVARTIAADDCRDAEQIVAGTIAGRQAIFGAGATIAIVTSAQWSSANRSGKIEEGEREKKTRETSKKLELN